MKLLYPLLVFLPVALALEWADVDAAWVFAAAAVAIVPLSAIMGRSTEELAAHTGPSVGGLLNATMGNAAELIITMFALRAGLIDLVKASLTGSILGNLLLIVGLSFVVGGARYKVQRFSTRAAGLSVAMLVLAVTSLVLPALFEMTHPTGGRDVTLQLSVAVAAVLIVTYAGSLFFSLKTHKAVLAEGIEHAPHDAAWSKKRSLVVLLVATAGVAWMSELLVGATEEATRALGLSELFVGMIIIPLIGNAAEHASAVWMAARDKMDLSLAIALNSSTQIALFVAPVLVFAGLVMGHPMTFVFTGLEVVAIALATGIITVISLDGESNWFEGAQLLAVYVLLGATFFFY